jgi:hypothetical protein
MTVNITDSYNDTLSRDNQQQSPRSIDAQQEKQVRQAFQFFAKNGLVELRALNARLHSDRVPYDKPRTILGWFDNADAIVSACKQIASASGLYVTINPCQPALLNRAVNRLKDKISATNDDQIVTRKYLILDCDPEREGHITGIPANEQEHQTALDFAETVYCALKDMGWPEPLRFDSGNGAYLIYPIDQPANDNGLVDRVLKGLAQRFDTEQVHIDLTTFNQARIARLPGTWNCKGDSTEDRPHRIAKILSVPKEIHPVPIELLEAVAVPVAQEQPKQEKKSTDKSTDRKKRGKNHLSAKDFVEKHELATIREEPYKGGIKLLLAECPFCLETDHCACIYDTPFTEPYIGFSCSHNRCKELKGVDLWQRFESKASDETSTDQAVMLVNLALSKADIFATPRGEVYARIRFADRIETIPVSDKGAFRRWLMHEYHELTGIIPQTTPLLSAVEVLVAKAEWGTREKRDVFVRKAYYQDKLYIDLANKDCQVVEVDKDGWRVLTDNILVSFRRPEGLLPLPVPAKGGKLSELKQFVNISDNDDWLLLQAWLLGSYHPEGPYPVLGLSGEGGSAKSSMARYVRRLIDPHEALLRREPKDEQTFSIMAHNSYVVALDNLSRISNKLSDMMCTLATGSGDAFRKHYSNNEEVIFNEKRPQIFTGIEELATRGDLIDRCILLSLPTIDKSKRRDEKGLDLAFAEAHPRILGALLDAVCLAMRNLPHTHLDEMPRMADFALWVQAAEEAITDEKGAILKAYYQNKVKGIEVELEASPIGKAIIDLMSNSEEWDSSTTDLLKSLNERVEEKTTKQRAWPKNARALSGLVKRITPSFRVKGIIIVQRRDEKGSWVTITKKKDESPDAKSESFASGEPSFASGEPSFASGEPSFASGENGSSTDFDPFLTQNDANNSDSFSSEKSKKEDDWVKKDDAKTEKNMSENLRHFASGNISLETFWAIGKVHGYPEIPDLGLKSGYMNWGSFVTFNRIRIPDVIARLGGR